MTATIRRFDRDFPVPESSKPVTVTKGDPTTTLHHYYSDAGNKFFCGIWESTPGAWRVDYQEEEFVVILSGKIILTPDDGVAEHFGPGDAFVIPAGFKGTWETIEPVRKYYAIYEPGNA